MDAHSPHHAEQAAAATAARPADRLHHEHDASKTLRRPISARPRVYAEAGAPTMINNSNARFDVESQGSLSMHSPEARLARSAAENMSFGSAQSQYKSLEPEAGANIRHSRAVSDQSLSQREKDVLITQSMVCKKNSLGHEKNVSGNQGDNDSSVQGQNDWINTKIDDLNDESQTDDQSNQGVNDDTSNNENVDRTIQGENDDPSIEGENVDPSFQGENDDLSIKLHDDYGIQQENYYSNIQGENDDSSIQGENGDPSIEGREHSLEASQQSLEASQQSLEGSKQSLGGSKQSLGGSKQSRGDSTHSLGGSKLSLGGSKQSLGGSKQSANSPQTIDMILQTDSWTQQTVEQQTDPCSNTPSLDQMSSAGDQEDNLEERDVPKENQDGSSHGSVGGSSHGSVGGSKHSSRSRHTSFTNNDEDGDRGYNPKTPDDDVKLPVIGHKIAIRKDTKSMQSCRVQLPLICKGSKRKPGMKKPKVPWRTTQKRANNTTIACKPPFDTRLSPIRGPLPFSALRPLVGPPRPREPSRIY